MKVLLEYGANPNMRGFSKPGLRTPLREDEYPFDYSESELSEWNDLTPLEAACKDEDYSKAFALSSFSPCTLQAKTIENSIKIILRSHVYDSTFDEKEDILKILIPKLSQKALLSFANDDVHYEQVGSCLFKKLFTSYKKRNEEITNLALVWIVLNRNHWQCGSNNRSILPPEILLKIFSHLMLLLPHLDQNAFAFIIERSSKEEILKISAFKKIYTILSENDTPLASHRFLKSNETVSSVRMIRKIQNKI